MNNTITVDVTSAVKDFYPGLTNEQAMYISEVITHRYDYASIYDEIYEQIESIAYRKGIELEGKDGVTEVNNVPHLNVIQGGKLWLRHYLPHQWNTLVTLIVIHEQERMASKFAALSVENGPQYITSVGHN